MSPHRIDTLPSLAALRTYGISKNGFLPGHQPLHCLPNAYFRPWESIMQSLTVLIGEGSIRHQIDRLPVLDTSYLDAEPEWHRAYSVLTMMAQAYIWGGEQPSERLPPAITVPLLRTSAHLEVNPIASYASLNLWNWALIDGRDDPSQPDNLRALNTLTGTDDESWFYVVSNAMEARGSSIMESMLIAMHAVQSADEAAVAHHLTEMSLRLDEIGVLLERMCERCDPQVFYHQIRPFLAGSMNMAAAGLPHGVYYDEGDGNGTWRTYRGGSNGQSSLIQFFDVVLGVDHGSKSSFHEEMRDYMPGPHARFLEDVAACANIREFVVSHVARVELVVAYNAAVASLTEFRNKHIQLVTRYIILPSRQPTTPPVRQKNLAAASTDLASHTGNNGEFVGTGGTKLVPFLRQTRDETIQASLIQSSSSGMSR